jgi:hypothetical protein
MGKISWTQSVQNDVLRRVNGERNILRTMQRRKSNWTGHMLRRNCLTKHVTEGKRKEDWSDGKTKKKRNQLTE